MQEPTIRVGIRWVTLKAWVWRRQRACLDARRGAIHAWQRWQPQMGRAMQAATVLRVLHKTSLLPLLLYFGLVVSSVAAQDIPVTCDPTWFPSPTAGQQALSCNSPQYFLVDHLRYSATWVGTDVDFSSLSFTHQELPTTACPRASNTVLALSSIASPRLLVSRRCLKESTTGERRN